MTKRITLLGSTGSIGTQSLDVIRAQGYEVFGLAANRNADLLLRQIKEFSPKAVAVVDPAAAQRVKSELEGFSHPPVLLEGAKGLAELAAMPGADILLNAVVGIAGSHPPLPPLRAAKIWHWPTKKALSPAALW